MNNLPLAEENWNVIQHEENSQSLVYKHAEQSHLKFDIKFDSVAKIIEFNILDGERLLGSSHTWAPDMESWKQGFIFNGGFKIFLQRQGLQMW